MVSTYVYVVGVCPPKVQGPGTLCFFKRYNFVPYLLRMKTCSKFIFYERMSKSHCEMCSYLPVNRKTSIFNRYFFMILMQQIRVEDL